MRSAPDVTYLRGNAEPRLHDRERSAELVVSRRRAVAAGLSLALISVAPTVASKPVPVSLGEVKTRVRRSERWLSRALRRVLARELKRVQLPPARKDEFVLSASLLRLTTKRGDGEVESVAVLSATLRKKSGGALHAILRGRAKVIDASASRRNELDAMRGAVRSVLRRLPEAVS